jgi:hypothetical protein
MIQKLVGKRDIVAVLSALLVLQVVLALALKLFGGEHDAYGAQATLLSFDKDAVDTVQFIDDNGKSLAMRKVEGRWQLVDDGFPADSKRLQGVLDSLAAMKRDWPAANTADAAERFKVSAKAFQREISLSRGDNVLAKLYLGTSPGATKIYARVDGEDDIHIIPYSTFDVVTNRLAWIDRDILKRSVDDIAAVTLPGTELKRSDDGEFVLNGLAKNQQTDAKKARELVEKVAALPIQDGLGKQNKPEFGQQNPKAVLKLSLKDGKAVTYTVSKHKEKDYYVLKSSEREEYLAVPTQELDPVLKTDRRQLVQAS